MGKKTSAPQSPRLGAMAQPMSTGRGMGAAPPMRSQMMGNALMGGGSPGMGMYANAGNQAPPPQGGLMGMGAHAAPPTSWGAMPAMQNSYAQMGSAPAPGNTMSNSMQGGLMGMPPLPGAQPGMPGMGAAAAPQQQQTPPAFTNMRPPSGYNR